MRDVGRDVTREDGRDVMREDGRGFWRLLAEARGVLVTSLPLFDRFKRSSSATATLEAADVGRLVSPAPLLRADVGAFRADACVDFGGSFSLSVTEGGTAEHNVDDPDDGAVTSVLTSLAMLNLSLLLRDFCDGFLAEVLVAAFGEPAEAFALNIIQRYTIAL